MLIGRIDSRPGNPTSNWTKERLALLKANIADWRKSVAEHNVVGEPS